MPCWQVLHYERECRILLQAENGPCPLLAIANVLLLSGRISLSNRAISTGIVTVDEVVTLIATKLLEIQPPVTTSFPRTLRASEPTLRLSLSLLHTEPSPSLAE